LAKAKLKSVQINLDVIAVGLGHIKIDEGILHRGDAEIVIAAFKTEARGFGMVQLHDVSSSRVAFSSSARRRSDSKKTAADSFRIISQPAGLRQRIRKKRRDQGIFNFVTNS
jgi:hypothetical protein